MNRTIELIYHHLLEQITTGKLPPGGAIPFETKLAEQFATNRMNVHRALQHLKEKGIVMSRRHAGTVVQPELNHFAAKRLLQATYRKVAILHAASPIPFHWNEDSYDELTKMIAPHGYDVIIRKRPVTAMLSSNRG